MTLQALESTWSVGAKADLLHLFCYCDEDRALCGADVSGMEIGFDGDECVVCVDLEESPDACPHCSPTAL